jgi:hypothetical protein
MLNTLAPGVATTAPDVQVVVGFGDVATTKPAGRVSVKLVLVTIAAPISCLSVTVSRVRPPAGTEVGRKDVLVLSPLFTVSVAVKADAFDPLEVCSAAAVTVLTRAAKAAPAATWTGTTIVQVPFDGIAPPLNETDVLPGVAIRVDAGQLVVAAGDAATVKPVPIEARLSVKDVMVAADALALFRVIVSVLEPLCGIDIGAKTFDPDTALAVRMADAVGNCVVPNNPAGMVFV